VLRTESGLFAAGHGGIYQWNENELAWQRVYGDDRLLATTLEPFGRGFLANVVGEDIERGPAAQILFFYADGDDGHDWRALDPYPYTGDVPHSAFDLVVTPFGIVQVNNEGVYVHSLDLDQRGWTFLGSPALPIYGVVHAFDALWVATVSGVWRLPNGGGPDDWERQPVPHEFTTTLYWDPLARRILAPVRSELWAYDGTTWQQIGDIPYIAAFYREGSDLLAFIPNGLGTIQDDGSFQELWEASNARPTLTLVSDEWAAAHGLLDSSPGGWRVCRKAPGLASPSLYTTNYYCQMEFAPGDPPVFQVQVTDAGGHLLVGSTVRVQINPVDASSYQVTCSLPSSGWCVFNGPSCGYGVHVWVEADGYEAFEYHLSQWTMPNGQRCRLFVHLDPVPPDPPTMTAEPGCTAGTSNTVSWGSLGAGHTYQVQQSRNAGFTGRVLSSLWIGDTSYTFDGLAHGQTYYYRVRARRNGLNSGWSNVVSSRQDAVPPTTTSTLNGTVGNGGWYRSNVRVTLSASDDGCGVTGTQYRVDGGGWQNYSGAFTVSGDGSHTVEYHSTDVVGNTESVRSRTFRIDTTAPNTHNSLSGTAGGGGWYRSDVQVTLSANDATSGVAGTQYRIDGGSWQNYGGAFTVSGDGSHTVEYRSTDVAGNTESTRSQTVQI